MFWIITISLTGLYFLDRYQVKDKINRYKSDITSIETQLFANDIIMEKINNARIASESGYKVLTFDFRGYGKSTGTKDTRMNRDLEAAVAYMRAKGAKEIILIGASMGGTAVIELALEAQVQGVVALSPPMAFGRIDALEAVKSMIIPLLLIVAENDRPYYSDARELENAAAATQFLSLPGQQHGTNLFIEHRNEVFANLLAFLDRWTDDSLLAGVQTES